MKNKGLRSFYSHVYAKKGERRHYTKLIFGKAGIPGEEREVLREMSWRGKTVLEIGCGTGLLCHEIAKRKASKVVGIDFAPGAIQVAQRTHQNPRLLYRCEDIQDHKGTYDVVVSVGTLEHMDDPFSVLRKMRRHVKPGGSLILTCPNWTNPRGYILQTLQHLFRAPITLADLHYLTPVEFQKWARELGLALRWRTFDHDWAAGERLIDDFSRRLPNVLRDSKLPLHPKRIDGFITWIQEHVLPLDHKSEFSGATGLYHLRKPRS